MSNVQRKRARLSSLFCNFFSSFVFHFSFDVMHFVVSYIVRKNTIISLETYLVAGIVPAFLFTVRRVPFTQRSPRVCVLCATCRSSSHRAHFRR